MEQTDLPADWEDEVARAYSVFGVDPLDSEFGFHFPKLSTSFLRTKALRQLRDRFGKWRQERGDLDLPGDEPQQVSRLVGPHIDPPEVRAPTKRIIGQDKVDAAVDSTLDAPGGMGARHHQMRGDRVFVENLVKHWINLSKHMELDPEVESDSRDASKWDKIEDGEGKSYSVTGAAKRLVMERLSDATRGTISMEELHGINSFIKKKGAQYSGTHIPLVGGGGKKIDPTEPQPDVGFYVRKIGSPIMMAIPKGYPREAVPYLVKNGRYGVPAPDDVNDWAAESARMRPDDADLDSYEITEPGTPEAETLIRDQYTSQIIKTWAQSANDNHAVSLAFQEMSKQNLLNPTAKPNEWSPEPETAEIIERLIEEHGPAMLAFLQAQKDSTLALMQSLGIDVLPLFRGGWGTPRKITLSPEDQDLLGPDWGGGDMSRAVTSQTTQRPQSSWATNAAWGAQYASNIGTGERPPDGFPWLISVDIPVEDLLATGITGFGAYGETEIVTLSDVRTAIAARLRTNAGEIDHDSVVEHLQRPGKNRPRSIYGAALPAEPGLWSLDDSDLNADWIKYAKRPGDIDDDAEDEQD